jgi:predicted HTH transcriptional regulator
MTLKNKVLDLITESDLQSLVENKVREAKVLDYKRALPGKSDREKREFLYDVSSFANASGGDLIFGVTERDGVASEISGLESGNVDEDILRLESIIRDGIDPRIPGLSIRAVNMQTTSSIHARPQVSIHSILPN